MMILVASISLILLRPVDGVVLSGIITLARGVSPGRLGVLDVDDAQVFRKALSYSYSPMDESRFLGALPRRLGRRWFVLLVRIRTIGVPPFLLLWCWWFWR
jgi:hypothetical protein